MAGTRIYPVGAAIFLDPMSKKKFLQLRFKDIFVFVFGGVEFDFESYFVPFSYNNWSFYVLII